MGDPVSGLKKATSLSNNDSWIDKVSDFLIGNEGRGQGLLGKAMTGLDQLSYGHNRDNDPDREAFLNNNNLRGTVSKADTLMGDPNPSMAMAPMGPKDIEGLSTGIKNMYSRVNEAAKTLPETFHPNRALSHIMNRAPKEEMETRSIANFLKSRGDQPTTRGDVTGYLEENPLKVEVKRLGGHPTGALESDNAGGLVSAHNGDEFGSTAGPAKYGTYTIPGGKNYREDLIKLDKGPGEVTPEKLMKWNNDQLQTGHELMTPETAQWHIDNNPARVDNYLRDTKNDQAFHSNHWDDPNVLAHVRHNERNLAGPYDHVMPDPTGPRGRFLEEIQSDWHEKGRDEGYKNPAEDQNLKDLGMKVDVAGNDLHNFMHNYEVEHGLPHEGTHDHYTNTYQHLKQMMEDPNHDPRYDQLHNDYFRLADAQDNAQQAYDQARRGHQSAVPNAPFKESWPDLALKQQVLDVADRPDLDWLGFTTGKTQNDRYKLSNSVSRIAFDHDPQTGQGELRAWGPDGREVLTQDIKDPKQIVDYIGKDAAARLTSQTPKDLGGYQGRQSYELTGENLDIGGEGMNTFYDERLPNTLNKILKPFGGKVEKGAIPGPPRQLTTGYKALPEPAEASYPQRYVGTISDSDSKDVIANTYPPIPFRPGAVPDARGEADDLARIIKNQSPNKQIPAWIAHLSPEMKKKILEKGLPLLMLMGLTQPNTDSQANSQEEY